MAPIRTAIIGLSSSAKTSWASGAHLPYLLSSRGRAKYQIVALCNSSVEAAERAINTYGLPTETRAYGDPQALAEDPNIDLVVDCTRVDVHHPTILPSVKAGKNVFVEWPLAHDLNHAQELANVAKNTGSRTVVGLQGRFVPVLLKIRQLLEEGQLGKVLSSQINGYGGTNSRVRLPVGLEYFTDAAIGGNIFTIGFGHLFDQVQYVLGDFQNLHGNLQLQRPEVIVFDRKTGKDTSKLQSNVPDLITITAAIQQSEITTKGASVLFSFRRGQPFPGEPPLVWTINGEKGEIRLIARGGTALHAGGYDSPVTIEVHDFETDEVKQVEWKWSDWQEELPIPARSVGAVYEAFAEEKSNGIVSFEDAAFRHQQLTELLSGWQQHN